MSPAFFVCVCGPPLFQVAQKVAQPVRHGHRTALTVHQGVLGAARCQQARLVLVPHLVYKAHGRAAPFADGRVDLHQIVIAGRGAVTALGLADGQDDVLFLHITVAHAAGADEFAARPLEDVEILRIVQNAHGICFTVGDPVGEPDGRGRKIVMHQKTPLRVGKGLPRLALCAVLLVALALSGCGSRQTHEEYLIPKGPAVGFESPEFFTEHLAPQNQDLQSWREMAPTVRKSLRYVKSKPAGAVAIDRPGLRLTWGDMERTLLRLQALLPRLDAEPQLFLQNFQWVEVPSGIAYSGYYEPRVKASRTRKPGYEQAIYALPPDMKQYKRRHKGRYYTRRQIEEQQLLAGRGLELAWAADPVDVFFLEIQGSGRLVFDDGTEAFINYAGQNGHKYKSSGRIMREKGLLKRGDIFEQRQWFKDNPQRVREILNENPSYVFFRYGSRGPTGAMGHVVDEWLSLAVDRSYIPLGAVVAFGVNVPDEKYGSLPLRGIGFAQDVGGAIKQRRIDLFCGGSERANYVASHLDAPGPAWVLVAR